MFGRSIAFSLLVAAAIVSCSTCQEDEPISYIQENPYHEYPDIQEDFPYYYEDLATVCSPEDDTSTDCIRPKDFLLNDFIVEGVNLATYKHPNPELCTVPRGGNTVNLLGDPLFYLYEDFFIGDVVQGNETWFEMTLHRRRLKRPSLTFYVDKVARKRWLAEKGYPQPDIYYIGYKNELSKTGKKEDLERAILKHLPTTHGFCAKPTHMSMTMGTWLVDIDPNHQDEVKFSTTARQFRADAEYDPKNIADSLAEGLLRKAAKIESWVLKNVQPGLVIEQLFTNIEDRSHPPEEFCIFVIWGRVYAAQWIHISDNDRSLHGYFYRDGSPCPGCWYRDEIPDWIPWEEMIAQAESLSTGKDMFRVDFLVGVPRYSEENTELTFVISESEIHPNSVFCNPFIAEEMARLWTAGYKLGRFAVIPNPEIPIEYKIHANITETW